MSPNERFLGIGLILLACYLSERFMLASSELLSWKTETTMSMVEALPPGFEISLQRLRRGGVDRAQFLADQLNQKGFLSTKGRDAQQVVDEILEEYDTGLSLATSTSSVARVD